VVLCHEIWPFCLVIPHEKLHLSERTAGFTVHVAIRSSLFLPEYQWDFCQEFGPSERKEVALMVGNASRG